MNQTSRGPSALISGIIIVLIILAAYANCYSCPFLFDDLKDIVNGTHFHKLWPIWTTMFQIPPGSAASGRPMVGLSLAFNYAVGGTSPFGYHLFNVLVHCFASLLLFGIVRRTLLAGSCGKRLARGASWISLAATLLWSVHPLQTESVTYVIKRNESMMGMFYLLTLYCFVRAVQGGHSTGWLIASVGACLMGMANKETMVTAPVIVYLYDRSFVEHSWLGPLRRRAWYYCALLATWTLLAYLIAGNPRGGVAGLTFAEFTPREYLLTQFGVVLHYLRLSIWPDALCIDYFDWPLARSLRMVAIQAVFIAAAILLTIWAVIRRPQAGFLGASFLIVLSPSSSVLPIRELVCEYRMYLPLAAVAVAVACIAWLILDCLTNGDRARAREVAFGALMTVVVLALAVRTRARNEDYSSPETMWADVVTKRPNNFRARGNLAGLQIQRRDFAAAERNHLAALRVKPDHFTSLLGMGNVCAQTNRLEEAAEYFDAALKTEPDNAGALANRGAFLASQGRYAEAAADLEAALRLRPELKAARLNLARVHEKLGRSNAPAQNQPPLPE